MNFHGILNKGQGRLRIARPVAMLAAVGVAMLGGIAFSATSASAAGDHQVWVCKYVGTPNIDERAQHEDGLIRVDANSTGVGGYFNDKQGASFVLDDANKDNTGTGNSYTGTEKCPGGRVPIVTVTYEHATSCTANSVRSVTTTIGWVYRDGRWVQTTTITYGEWVNSVPTAEQLAGRDCTRDPIVTVTDQHETTCTNHRVRSVTTTTEWVKVNGQWAKGEPVITYGEWVNSVPTAEQLAGRDCANRLIEVTPEATATLGDCRGAGRVALGNNRGYSWSGNTGSSDSPTYTATANAGYKLIGTGVFTFPGLSQLRSDSAACAAAPTVLGVVKDAPVKAAPVVKGVVKDAVKTLAFTGAETVPLSLSGLLALLLGAVLTVASRQRPKKVRE